MADVELPAKDDYPAAAAAAAIHDWCSKCLFQTLASKIIKQEKMHKKINTSVKNYAFNCKLQITVIVNAAARFRNNQKSTKISDEI